MHILRVLVIVGGRKLIAIEDSSLTVNGYQLLHIAISQLMGDNREFYVSGIF